MRDIRRSTFFIGFLIGALIAAIVWYYQKSTSAEDGALDLLDRLAQTQANVRDLEARLRDIGPAERIVLVSDDRPPPGTAA